MDQSQKTSQREASLLKTLAAWSLNLQLDRFKIQDYLIISSEKFKMWLNINQVTVHNNTFCIYFKTQRTVIENTEVT